MWEEGSTTWVLLLYRPASRELALNDLSQAAFDPSPDHLDKWNSERLLGGSGEKDFAAVVGKHIHFLGCMDPRRVWGISGWVCDPSKKVANTEKHGSSFVGQGTL